MTPETCQPTDAADKANVALLPCPHCGEREQLYPAYRMDKLGRLKEPPYAIDCLGCGTDFTPRDGVDARAAWNRRAPALLPADVAGLQQARVDFDTFINEPCEFEDEMRVRDYRHQLYRKWAPFRATLSALSARLERAEEVIEPFAKAAASYEPDEGDGDDLSWNHRFTIGHLRAALAWKEKR